MSEAADIPLEESFGIVPIKRISGLPTDPLTVENTKVLLILQKRRTLPSFFCCPKGHAESSDANHVATAIRELREETGLLVRPEGLLFDAHPYRESYVNPHTRGKKTVTYFVGLISSDQEQLTLQENEVEAAIWLTWNEAIEKATYLNTKDLLKRVMIYTLKVSTESLHLEIKDQSFGIIPIASLQEHQDLPIRKSSMSTRNTKVLLIQQKTFDGYGRTTLHWAFPKGHPEPGENSPLKSAVRELAEETGLVSQLVWETPSFSMSYWSEMKQCWKKVTLWIGVVDEKHEIKCEDREVNQAGYFSWEEALELISTDCAKEVLRKVIAVLDSFSKV